MAPGNGANVDCGPGVLSVRMFWMAWFPLVLVPTKLKQPHWLDYGRRQDAAGTWLVGAWRDGIHDAA